MTVRAIDIETTGIDAEDGGSATGTVPGRCGRTRTGSAGELAGLGEAVPGQRERPPDTGQPGEGRLREDARPASLARVVAAGRVLVADRAGRPQRDDLVELGEVRLRFRANMELTS